MLRRAAANPERIQSRRERETRERGAVRSRLYTTLLIKCDLSQKYHQARHVDLIGSTHQLNQHFLIPVPVSEPSDLQNNFVSGLAREESTLEASLISGLYKVTMRT